MLNNLSFLQRRKLFYGGVYLKKFELILRTIGSAGGIPPKPPFRPPRLEAEAKRTISNFSLVANSFNSENWDSKDITCLSSLSVDFRV